MTTVKVQLDNNVLLPEVCSLLEEGREVILTPKGNSMLPVIHGDKDSVKLHRETTLEVGDIVLAKLYNRYVLHRIINIDGDDVTLMGDGNISGTERCRRDDIAGTVTGIIRPSGKEIKPGKARLWRALKPFRRYILAIYRRISK